MKPRKDSIGWLRALSYCLRGSLARIFHTQRRVRARGLQGWGRSLVGRVPSRGALLPLCGLAALIGLSGATSGSAQSSLLDSRFGVKNAVIAVHLGWEAEPVAVLRAERVFGDYQTRGFFRIGALPMLVIDRLRIELRDADRLSTVLARVGESFVGRGAAWKAVEGRDFCLSFAHAKDGQLLARRIRLESGNAWGLLDGVVQPPEGVAIPFTQATLTITGPRAGELVCETAGGTIRTHLLSLSKSTTNKPPL